MTFRDDFSLSLKKNFNNHSYFAFSYLHILFYNENDSHFWKIESKDLCHNIGLDRLRQAGSTKGFEYVRI